MKLSVKINFKYFFLFLFITIIAISENSCFLSKNSATKSYKKVSIVDPGMIYSTYSIEDSEKKIILDNGISFKQFQDIAEYSRENTWPIAMQTLSTRINNRENIKKYSAYLVTTFNDKCILLIPAKKNKHMIPDMQLKRDFYIIIGCSGIK